MEIVVELEHCLIKLVKLVEGSYSYYEYQNGQWVLEDNIGEETVKRYMQEGKVYHFVG